MSTGQVTHDGNGDGLQDKVTAQEVDRELVDIGLSDPHPHLSHQPVRVVPSIVPGGVDEGQVSRLLGQLDRYGNQGLTC